MDKKREYVVFIVKNDDYLPARLVKDRVNKSLSLKSGGITFSQDFYGNWFLTLRKLDDQAGEKGLRIINNGTSRNVYSCGFCVNMGDGSLSYHNDGGLEVVETLKYSDWNEYATEDEQKRSFFVKENEG